MTFLHALILRCLDLINAERTVYSVYHLLAGKKSSQTIQDAHLYRLSHLFKTLPGLKRQQFDSYIKELYKKSYINLQEDTSKCIVTIEGKKAYSLYFDEREKFDYIHGWKFQDTSIQFWKRFTLLVQALSHINHSVNRYFPIQRDEEVFAWIRKFIGTYRGNRAHISKELYAELYKMFSTDFPEDPYYIVSRLSGFEMIGLTQKQVSEFFGLEEIESYFRFLNGLHFMIQTVIKEKSHFPILFTLTSDIYRHLPLTNSTIRTYNLLQQEYTIPQIAKMRNIKEGTVEDHIIEIALMDSQFSIEPFVERKQAVAILETAKELGQKKLKPIREKVKDSSYFQIRLVLAKAGEKM
ncbi:helix-turn-helix domain-containing protein [Bacillus sp. FJAT-49732]|uniref:Helix-turn-helix domain-containing protein n=1 Tax=Lederbergia citrisecunda TaxID=2833583 RepID=A0A942YMP7_9BACI|nr:helix-turn-helix domain-containing protein [Lederbergia citrisecunda]MBS4199536.1 helix-turn-helix domain-containing protein [Lederbergia citrisecunda]